MTTLFLVLLCCTTPNAYYEPVSQSAIMVPPTSFSCKTLTSNLTNIAVALFAYYRWRNSVLTLESVVEHLKEAKRRSCTCGSVMSLDEGGEPIVIPPIPEPEDQNNPS